MAIAILGTVTAVNSTSDATSHTLSTHSVSASTEMLWIAIETRSFDGTNPPSAWTVTWNGSAVTEAWSSFDDTPFSAGRPCVWLGYIRTPATGAQNCVISTGSNTHRGMLTTFFNLTGAKASGSPLGAISSTQFVSPADDTVAISLTPSAPAADNLLHCLMMISLNQALVSFTGTGTWTSIFSGQFGNFPRGESRYRLGVTSAVTCTCDWSGASTTGNLGGVVYELLAEATTIDDTVTETVTVADAASLATPSQASTSNLSWLAGRSEFTWLTVLQPDSAVDDAFWVRIGDAATAAFVLRGRINNGQGSNYVYRWSYNLTDGTVIGDTEAGTQTTSAFAIALTHAAGAGGRVYLDGELQDGYRSGAALTGSLQLAGNLEIGKNATGSLECNGLMGRLIVDGTAWPAAKVDLVSRGCINGRAIYGLGEEETAVEAATATPRSPIALPMRLTLAGQQSLDFMPAVSDPNSTNWTVSSVTQPSGGTLAILSDNRTLRLTPSATGTIVCAYVISGGGKTSTGRAEVEVTRPQLAAANDSITVVVNSSGFVASVLANDTYTPPVRITSVSAPAHGTAVITADQQQVRYTPTAAYTGSDSFTYTVTDAFGTSSATVSVTVVSAPTEYVTANGDTITTTRGTAVDISVLANDSGSSALQVASVTTPAHGTTEIVNASSQVRYTPASGYTGADSFNYTARLASNASVTGSATVSVTVNAPAAAGDWQRLDWGGSVEPGSRRSWNIGVMSASSAAITAINGYLGFQQAVIGGRCFKTDAGTYAFLADTWEKMMGGPVTGGDTITEAASMVNLATLSATKAWLNKTDGFTNRHWCYWGICPVPFGTATVETIREVIRGVHDDKYRRIGSRLRALIDSKSQDYRKVICRFGYEFNQDTAFALNNGTGVRRGFFSGPDTTLQMWRDFCSRAISKIREGYGYSMKMAISPAMQSTSVRNSLGWLKLEDLLVPEFDVCCGSFHPIDDRITTEAAALATANALPPATGTIPMSTLYTPAYIAQVARAQGRKIAFLEHNLATEQASYYDGDLTYAQTAYNAFGRVCNDNADIMAFTCLLGSAMVNESFLGTPSAARDTTSRADQWARLCRAYKNNFGRAA